MLWFAIKMFILDAHYKNDILNFVGQPGSPGLSGSPSYPKPTGYPSSSYPGSPGNLYFYNIHFYLL